MGQALTGAEGAIANGCDTVWDGDLGQSDTVPERMFPDGGDAVAKGELVQVDAAGKGIPF